VATGDVIPMRYEFFSWKGFLVGSVSIAVAMVLQSMISFPLIWEMRSMGFTILIIVSSLIVGFASGSVLIFLFPPDQDVIGMAGLGSDDLTQHIALFWVVLALLQPMLSGFVFFFEYFGTDPFAMIWVLIGFAAPSAGFAIAMYDRTNAIANDLKLYFAHNQSLDIVSLDWLHGLGPRTAAYRMGMLESAAEKAGGLRVRGHQIVRISDPFPINN